RPADRGVFAQRAALAPPRDPRPADTPPSRAPSHGRGAAAPGPGEPLRWRILALGRLRRRPLRAQPGGGLALLRPPGGLSAPGRALRARARPGLPHRRLA